MIPLHTFIADIERNIFRIKQYQLGHDGSDGLCDCIGLIIGAVRLAGEKWPWTHGSNYTARYLLDGGIRKGAPLQTGDLVFKAYKPNDKYYDLPSRYKNSGDLLDYYHVGVVVSTNPLVIKHCTQSSKAVKGIATDTERGKWEYSGWLKLIKKEEGAGMIGRVIVLSGNTVNIRVKPDVNSQIVCKVEKNCLIDITECGQNGWDSVVFGSHSGYMMNGFLEYITTSDNARLVMDINEHLNEAKRLLTDIV